MTDPFTHSIAGMSMSLEALVVRMLGAALLGAVIGLDREWRARSAGLRTHILTALSAAAFGIVTLEIMAGNLFKGDAVRLDPIRVIEAVTAGVAFLAAGAIIRSGQRVQGLTTGAGMWLAGAVGVSSGLGLWPVAVTATVVGIVVLTGLGWLERRVTRKGGSRREDE